MINRRLHFVLCACLLLAPLGILAAQDMDDGMMEDDGSFSISAGYGVALPADRTIGDRTISTWASWVGGSASVTPSSDSDPSCPSATAWPTSRTRMNSP
jgi:hypothetical protein